MVSFIVIIFKFDLKVLFMIISEEQIGNILKIQTGLNIKKGYSQTKSNTKSIEPSSRSAELKLVKSVLLESPEIRQERIALIKENIAQGDYRLTARTIASKMITRSLADSTLNDHNLKDG